MVIVLGLIYWVVTLLPLPEPFKQIAVVVIVIICLLYLISMLAGYAGPFPVFRGPYRY